MRNGSNFTGVKLWLMYGAFCSGAGWILSAIHLLNRAGYAIAILAALCGGIYWVARCGVGFRYPSWRRLSRPLPLIYLLMLAMAMIGGLLHPPNNYDMLTYRLPRMLHWLDMGQWNWIHSYNQRMNYSATGWEWAAMPMFALARSIRPLFVLNIISYLLLPGLIFAFLREFCVSGRVAWKWMWLLPTGLNFVMQAGGGANDTISVVFLLASIVFAFRARRSGSFADIFWSILSAGLLTGCKASNLPLMLPCLIALLPTIPKLRHHLPAAAAMAIIALLSSFAPTMLLNFKYTHDWAGSPNDEGKLKVHNPVAGLFGNTMQIAMWNLEPPVFPMASKWNDLAQNHFPERIGEWVLKNFPRFSLHMGELPQEEAAGLGLAVTAMAALSLIGGKQTKVATKSSLGLWRWAIITGGIVALLAFMATLGSESAARLAAPYYPFLLTPLLLRRSNNWLVRRRWWNVCAILAGLSAVPGVVLSPSRPLFPAVTFTQQLADAHPNSAVAQRAATVYRIYADRTDNLSPLRPLLANEQNIGFVCSDDDSEFSLWQPLGSGRRVVEVTPDDIATDLAAAHVHRVVIGAAGLDQRGISLNDLLQKIGGRIIDQRQITVKAVRGPEWWYVVEVR